MSGVQTSGVNSFARLRWFVDLVEAFFQCGHRGGCKSRSLVSADGTVKQQLVLLPHFKLLFRKDTAPKAIVTRKRI